MLPLWGFVEDPYIHVIRQLRLHQKGLALELRFRELWLWLPFGYFVEMLSDIVAQFFMVHSTSPHNYDVRTEVVIVVVIDNHIASDLVHVLDLSEDGQSHLVIFVCASMRDFDRRFKLHFSGFEEFSIDGIPLIF